MDEPFDPENRLGRYVLDGEAVIPCPDLLAWAFWFDSWENRLVAQDYLDDGAIMLSTMFIGLDHRFGGGGPPLVFETMMSGPYGWGDYQVRYATWDDAWAGHHAQLKRLQEDWERLRTVDTKHDSNTR